MPVVEGGEPAGDRRDDRHLPGGVPGHDLRVLLVPRRPPLLRGERADVVGHEPVHRRHRLRVRGRVVRGGHVLAQHAPVAGRVDDPEQLGVDVRVLLPRVRVRGIGVRRHRVGHDPAVRARAGPGRDRVAQLLADHALERGDFAGLVQAAQEVVERAILEHNGHDVIELRPVPGSGHDPSSACPCGSGQGTPTVCTRVRVMSEPEGRGAAWTEERGSLRPSDEGRRCSEGGMGRRAGARRRAGNAA